MGKILNGAVAAVLAASLAISSAHAQHGQGQGGPPQTGVGQRDMDQLRDQDQDRDRLYLGSQDRIRQHDQDRDGRISRPEFQRWHEEAFSALDADQSGGFTLQEFLRAHLGPGPQGYSATRRQRVEERAQLRKTERFRLMDGNGDGIVSRSEYMNFGELNYLDADANDDGRLTFRELQQFHRGM